MIVTPGFRLAVLASTSCLALGTATLPNSAGAQEAPAASTAPGAQGSAADQRITAPAAQRQTEETAPDPVGDETDANEVEAIVVTGFRGSLTAALNVKRQSSGVVDAINAQDVADFPDANLADSLQRIPGISVERDAGEGRTITVRGLGGDFSRTRFNGLEAISATTGSTLGSGVNRGRSFDYSLFASELFSSIVVRKTQSAEVDEGSLGATVDLQTARPFDRTGFQAALSAQAAYYDINETISPRIAALISNTWADDRIGLLFSLAYNKRDVQEDAYSSSAGDYSDVNNGFCPVVPNTPTIPVNPSVGVTPRTSPCIPASGPFPGSTPSAYNVLNQPNVFVPRNPGYGRFNNKQERLGVTATFQVRPTDSTLVTVGAAYSRFAQDRIDLATNPISFNRAAATAAGGLTGAQLTGRPNMKVRDATVDRGLIVYGLFDDTDFSVTQGREITETEFRQVDLNIEQEIGQRGELTLLVGKSESVFDSPYFIQTTFSRFDGDGFIYDAREDRTRPILNYGFNAEDPNNWQFQPGYDNIRAFTANVANKLSTAKLDFRYELSDRLTARIGFAAKRFEFISKRQQRIAATTSIPTLASAGLTIADVSTSPIRIDSLDLGQGATTSFIVPDLNRLVEAFDVTCYCVNQYGDWRIAGAGTGAQGDNRSVTETDTSPYAQLDFEFDLRAGMTLRGDVGLRYARTEQESNGFVGAGTAVTVSRSYEDWLPSLNVAVDVTPKLILRASAARAMSRPSLGFLTPGGAINIINPPFSATVGNPGLDPYRATNYDLSVEWYFQPEALLSAAFFHKSVESFVQQLSTATTYAAAGLPLSLLQPNQDPETTTNITTFQNTAGGKINGLEIQYQQPFTFLPGPLANFGAILNYTYIESELDYVLTTNPNGGTITAPLINVSPHSANATLYYEDDRLSARISLAYRDEYLRQIPVRAGIPDVAGSYSSSNIDASVSYKINEQFTATLDAINLTNQPTSYWDGKERRNQQVYSTTGRQFFVGGRYRF